MSTPRLLRAEDRLVLAAVAFFGTFLYAVTFLISGSGRDLAPLAGRIGIASAVSWPLFGLGLVVVTRGRPSLLSWVDLCLCLQAEGIAVLGASMVINLLDLPVPAWGHGIIIGISNAVMGAEFVRGAQRRGLNTRAALLLWLGLLDGVFALLMAVL